MKEKLMRSFQKLKNKVVEVIGNIKEIAEEVKARNDIQNQEGSAMDIIVTKDGLSYFIVSGGYDIDTKMWKLKAFVMPKVYHSSVTLLSIIVKRITRNHYWSAFIRDMLEFSIPMSDIEIPVNEVSCILKMDLDETSKGFIEQFMLKQFRDLFDKKMSESMSSIGNAITAEDADQIEPNMLLTYSINITDWSILDKLDAVGLRTVENTYIASPMGV